MQYEPAKVETFIDLYITGLYTLKEMCAQSGFSVTTYYVWKHKNPEFQRRIKQADKIRIGEIKEIATRGLIQLISSTTYDEVYEEFELQQPYIPLKNPFLAPDDPINAEHHAAELKKFYDNPPPPIMVKRRTATKMIMPNAQSVQFALRNMDRENFPDVHKSELAGEGGGPVAVLLQQPGSMNLDFPSDFEAAADAVDKIEFE